MRLPPLAPSFAKATAGKTATAPHNYSADPA